ncbi:MAG: single-stranded DNA-binding protein, partial [bacterium]|nr:single-stranded DNA-binding protein [bacterium]
DTSNEIAGDGDISHPGIGHARRMQVPTPNEQHAVMIEAVENHMPEVIVIDEIGTEAEALAARTIAERGVQLIATAHGNTLDNLLRNPTLSDLLGGIQAVTLSDEEARRRGTQKTVLERKAPPTFDVLIEIQERDRLAVYHDVTEVVDYFLRGRPLDPQLRMRTADGGVEIQQPTPRPDSVATPRRPRRRTLRVFPYAVNKSRLEQAIQSCEVTARVVTEIEEADVVLTLKSHARHQPRRLRDAQARGVPLHAIRNNTVAQMASFLRAVFERRERPVKEDTAMREAETAIRDVMEQTHSVELVPQGARMRRLQHQLAEGYGLTTRSTGIEPYRRVVIYPPEQESFLGGNTAPPN